MKTRVSCTLALSSLVISLCALLSGCSSRPSAASGRQAILNSIKSNSQGHIRLVDFRKTDGAEGELSGFKIYRLDFTAEIEFTERCKWVTGFIGSHVTLATIAVPSNQGMLGFAENAANPGTVVKKGQRAQISGSITFMKKENGWSVTSIEISKASLMANAQAPVNPGPISRSENKAFQILLSKAQSGSPKAQYEVSRHYFNGEGVTKNTEAAFSWATKAAQQGNPEGQNALGWYYLNGIATQTNYQQALLWFNRAANQNNSDAQVNLANMYSSEKGVTGDPKKAVSLLRKAALAGNAQGQFQLAKYYEIGYGVTENAVEHAIWLEKAAEQGLSRAEYELANLYTEGKGVEQDNKKAFAWYRKVFENTRKTALESGDPRAEFLLAHMYELGQGVSTNTELAVKWYRKVVASTNQDLVKVAKGRIVAVGTDPIDIARRKQIACINNLKRLGLAFRIWAGDNNDKFAFNESPKDGGTKGLCSPGADGFASNAYLTFEVMSNDINDPQILICPFDTNRHPAIDFQHLEPQNVSYRLRSGKNVKLSNPDEVLIVCPIDGNTLYCDGGVVPGHLPLGTADHAFPHNVKPNTSRVASMNQMAAYKPTPSEGKKYADEGVALLNKAYSNRRTEPPEEYEKQLRQAVKLFRESAKAGWPDGESHYGLAIIQGRGVPTNVAEGLRWVRKAASEGSEGAILNLGIIYARGLFDLPKDTNLARKYFLQLSTSTNAVARKAGQAGLELINEEPSQKTGRVTSRQRRFVQQQISIFKIAIEAFQIDNGTYPKRLEDLILRPASGGQNWHGPYVDASSVPKDPWGNEYVYRAPGSASASFEVFSPGPDGRPGTADDIAGRK